MSETPLDVAAAARLIAARELSPVDLVRDLLDRIEHLEPRVHAYATLLPEQALAAAREAEEQIARGDCKGPLHGIPIGLKDLIDTAGVPTTWGSRAHANRVPSRDAEPWRRLHVQGAILIGKTVTHEMGCGTLSPPTSNPWQLEHGPGGSSGGSAAALAAGLCLGALGTDTGGSVRIPAACTGTVGLKPTFGLVPTDGAMVASWSLDHVGPMARSVDGVHLLLSALAGADIDVPDGIAGLRVGVVGGWFRDHVQPGVLAAVDAAVQTIADLGARLVDIDLACLASAPPIASRIALPELASLHRRELDHADLLSAQVRDNLERGIVEPAIQYLDALSARDELRHAIDEVFVASGLDALAMPTLPITAARKDQPTIQFEDGYTESTEDAYVRFCVGWNVTGLPALSLPCGYDAARLPVGLQLVAPRGRDGTVLSIGRAFQSITDYHVALAPA